MRRRLSKNKFKNMSFFKKNLLIAMASLVLVCFTMVGYAALNQTLNISGDLVLRAKKDMRITDLKIAGTPTNAYEQYNSKYTSNTISVFPAFESGNSSISYEATITNKGNVDMEITNINKELSDDSVKCSVIGIYKDTIIEAGTTKTFTITLTGSNSTSDDMSVGLLLEITWDQYYDKYLTYNISGNSVQGENIIGYPYSNISGYTENGITYTINKDKSITANGTATKDSYFRIGNVTLEANKTYIISQAPKNSSSSTYRLLLNEVTSAYTTDIIVTQTVEKTAMYYIYIKAGTTLENVTFYPKISEVPTPEKPAEIQSVGDKTKNLCSNNYLHSTLAGYDNYVVNDGVVTTTGNTIMGFIAKVEPNTIYTASYFQDATKFQGNSMAQRIREYSDYPSEYGANYIGQISEKWSTATEKVSSTFTTSETTKYVMLSFYSNGAGMEISNFQVEEGSVATEYEPYGKYKIPIEVSGKNLLNSDRNLYTTVAGITVTYNNDGSISYKGTSTMPLSLYLTRTSFTLPAGTYTINDVTANCQTYLLPGYKTGTFTLTEETTFTGVYVNVPNGTTLDDNLYPQLEEGSTATEYEPYVEPITTNIYLDEPLRKLGNYADYIDFETKTLYRNVSKFVIPNNAKFNSTAEDRVLLGGAKSNGLWTANIGMSPIWSYQYPLKNLNTSFLLSSNGNFYWNPVVTEFGVNAGDDNETIKNPALQSWLKQQSEDVKTVYYVLATTDPTPIELPEIIKQPYHSIVTVKTSVKPNNIAYDFLQK